MRLQIPLLQRYVFGEVLRIFVFVVLCLTVLLVFVGVFQQASQSGLGPMQLIRILPYIVPSLLPFTIPAALLLTVSIVYGRLAGDLEITAAKAAGISVSSLLWPSFVVGAALSAFSLILIDQAIPWAVGNIQRTVVEAMEEIVLDRLKTERQFGDRRSGLHVTVESVEGRVLKRPVFQYQRGKSQAATMWADEATIRLDPENDQVLVTLSRGTIELPDQQRIYINREETRAIRWKASKNETQPRHLPIRDINRELDAVASERRRADERMIIEAAFAMTQGDFESLLDPKNRRKKQLSDIETRTNRMQTEIHSRYAMACSCLFFVLVGAPLAVLKAKARFLTSFLYCFVPITTGYYPLVLGMMAQSKKGHVDPMWAMWIGNAALAFAGYLLLRRVLRH